MAGIMAVFHNVAGADLAEARIRRHVGPFDKIRIENVSDGEEPIGPDIPLASAVLSSARKAGRDTPPGASGVQPGGPEARQKDGEADVGAGSGTGPGEDYLGDEQLRARLEDLGVGAHRSDWYLKQVLHGYVVLYYKFESPDSARRAWPVLERAGAISLENTSRQGGA